jgi:hypothetical protein
MDINYIITRMLTPYPALHLQDMLQACGIVSDLATLL